MKSLLDKIKALLKRRGTKTLPEEPSPTLLVVPKNRLKAALIVGIALSIVGGAGWGLWSLRHKMALSLNLAQSPAKPISAPQPASAPAAETTASAVESAMESSHTASSEAPKPIVVSDTKKIETPEPVASQKIEAQPEVHADTAEHGTHAAPVETHPTQEHGGHATPANETHPVHAADNEKSKESENNADLQHESRTRPSATEHKSAAHKSKHKKVHALTEPDSLSDHPSITPDGGVDKRIKPLTPQQQAEISFRKATELMQQGQVTEALTAYQTALQFDPGHDAARQAMVALLLENRRNADAERVLQEGLKNNIKHSGFAMLLARIQVERDASWSALLTLQKTLPYAENQADYQAFIAALLQRLNRHKEAVAHYQTAVQLSPNSAVWWMGLGISLKALQRNDDARSAFSHALESDTLNADLRAFVARQLKELQP